MSAGGSWELPNSATIYTETGAPALVIEAVKRRGDTLVIEGKALGSMYMDMLLPARDFPRLLRVVCSWGMLSFLLLLPVYALRSMIRRLAGRKAHAGDQGAGR
jgi:hypothetical protein